MSHVKLKRLVVFLLLVFTSLAVSSADIRSLLGYPIHIRIQQGTCKELNIGLPFDISITSNKERALRIGNNFLGKTALQFGGKSKLTLTPIDIGRYEVEFKLLNSIPVRRMIIEVVPKIQVIPGGHAVGVLLAAQGVIVLGHFPVKGIDGKRYYPSEEAGIIPGDVICKINGKQIDGVAQVEELVDTEGLTGKSLLLEIHRGDQKLLKHVTPILSDVRSISDGKLERHYRLGLYIRDNAAGVGTLTFYDPASRKYGALGHVITDMVTNQKVEVDNGRIVNAYISGIQAGVKGKPGEKIGSFGGSEDILGDINKNTILGIFGKMARLPGNPYYNKPIAVALVEEVHEGPAEILTVINGYKIDRFAVHIDKVYRQKHPSTKGMVIRVVDPRLIKATGGIIQGMSGSPIIQNGKLIGAVTHVFVSDPTRGYGVMAEWMINVAGISAVQENSNVA